MKRQIIKIDEEKCNGCGQCVTGCPEGALAMIDGKAKVINDQFCDGMGACIGHCPQGAITVEEKDTASYSERDVMQNIVKSGPAVIKAHLDHLLAHNAKEWHQEALTYLKENNIPVPTAAPVNGHSCPGSTHQSRTATPVTQGSNESALSQWPVQLKLLNPAAPFFENADLLIAADCTAFSSAIFHSKFLQGKKLIVFCPKLDPYREEYIAKLTDIFTLHTIKSVTVVRMEVPCCGGVNTILQEALTRAGKSIMVREYVVSTTGELV